METNLTVLINKWANGDHSIEPDLMAILYPTIHKIARNQLNKHHNRYFETTEVVSEAFIKLDQQKIIQWKNRDQFFAIITKIIRRLLIDEFRAQTSKKRGGIQVNKTLNHLSSSLVGHADVDFNLIEFDKLLNELSQHDEKAAQVVELKFFGGFTQAEISKVCNMSITEVINNWQFARSWLLSQLVKQ